MSIKHIIGTSIKTALVRIQKLGAAARIFASQLHAADARRLPGA